MNMTLHVTDECNLACKYCYQTRTPDAMSEETARKAVDLSIAASAASMERSNLCALSSENPANGASGFTGICFFGGEPLLMRQLILRTLDYCSSIHKEMGHRFNFKLVTNGTLLDEAFMRVVDENGIGLGFSHDGLMQDDERIYPDGSGTAGMLDAKMQMILAHQPEVMVMCTVHPASVRKFADSVQWLFDRGFRKIYTTPAVGEKVAWTDEDLNSLGEQYSRISKMYVDWTLNGVSFSFPAFDTKIESRIMGEAYKHKNCRFGQKQVSIAPDGGIYPCLQFVGDPIFRMGDVFSGISDSRKTYVIQQGRKEPTICSSCALRTRCKYNCCCQNKQMTGEIDQVSPFTCNHEQLLIRYADEAANELFARKDPTFLKKQYENRLRMDGFNVSLF